MKDDKQSGSKQTSGTMAPFGLVLDRTRDKASSVRHSCTSSTLDAIQEK